MNKRAFQTLVLGLGGMGSAAAYWLARQTGGGVLELEQFTLRRVWGGSSHVSRIIRLSCHNFSYVNLTKDVSRVWSCHHPQNLSLPHSDEPDGFYIKRKSKFKEKKDEKEYCF